MRTSPSSWATWTRTSLRTPASSTSSCVRTDRRSRRLRLASCAQRLYNTALERRVRLHEISTMRRGWLHTIDRDARVDHADDRRFAAPPNAAFDLRSDVQDRDAMLTDRTMKYLPRLG